MKENSHVHENRLEIVRRLKRTDGHLKGVIEMIKVGRSCPDVAQQLHAVEKAICKAKKTLIRDRLDYCLEDVVAPHTKDPHRAIDEFKEITKYL